MRIVKVNCGRSTGKKGSRLQKIGKENLDQEIGYGMRNFDDKFAAKSQLKKRPFM